MREKDRVGYVDIAKLIAILAVIYDHSQYYVPALQQDNAYIISRVFLFSFYLQVFFMAAGVIDRENYAKPVSWLDFLKKQVLAIGVPYVVWAAILSPSWSGSFVKSILWGTQTSLSTVTDSILWFLPVLFWAKVIYRLCMHVVYRLFKKESPVILLACALLLGLGGYLLSGNGSNTMIWGLDIALMGAALIILGRWMRPLLKWIRQGTRKRRLSVAGVGLAVAMVLAYANVTLSPNAQGILGFLTAVWMAHGYFGVNWLLFLISSAVSCVFVMTVAMLLESYELLPRLGQNTLGFMLLHGRLFPLAVSVTCPLLGVLSAVPAALVVSLVDALLCIPVIWFINWIAPALLSGKAIRSWPGHTGQKNS